MAAQDIPQQVAASLAKLPPATPQEIRKRFGDRMRRRREDVDLTQGDVAEQMAVSQQAMSKLERQGIADEHLLARLWFLYRVPEPYPEAPRDPIRRREFFERRGQDPLFSARKAA